MNYTFLPLFITGLLGVLTHNLVKINEINHDPSKGKFNLMEYWAKEWAAVFISIITVGVLDYFRNELVSLDEVSKYAKLLGLIMFPIGYMAQSMLIAWMGKAGKIAGTDDKNNG